ncbi:MAG: hypothetical protein L6R42_007707 [Xanthoria sp. 1 TBL-2021]|nr:MAG: hypothetical protein L6R42_007707 [Xanthoria sp. 1 TBL-2021]
MDPPQDPDTAIKNRIITHMNTSHQDSLIRYLRHTHHLSPFTARNATLNSLTLSSLTISLSPSNAKKYIIPILPPMETYTSARTRLADMDAAACTALGLSPITLKKYIPPRGLHLAIFITVVLELLIFALLSFLPPSTVHTLFSYIPSAYGEQIAGFAYAVRPWVLGLIIGIHPLEAWYMDRTRLQRYNVARFGKLWWMWMGSTVVEGWGAFMRVDGWVRGEEERRAGVKH